jgi:2-hydroxy-6-oxonona-2,4-dienedioate hydrolase
MPLRETVRATRVARHLVVATSKGRMHARVLGQAGAAPLVLVPGLGLSANYLLPTAIRLADRFEIWGPDLPGFGASESPGHTLTISELADALAEFLVATSLGPVHLLTNSLGCQIALDLALRYPERVSRMVLVGPTVDRQRRTAAEQLFRVAGDAFRERPSLIPLVAYDYIRSGIPRTWRTMFHAIDDPVESKLSGVRHPTLVVRGQRDTLVSQHWAEVVTDLLPRGRLAVIEGAPHAAVFSAPGAVALLARAFLAEDQQPLTI